MIARLKPWVVPAFLLLCLILGGSVQRPYWALTLQMIGVALIGWSVAVSGIERIERPGRQLLMLAAAALGVVALQLVPVPPALWSALPCRESVEGGFRLLGQPLPWLPISLTPYDGLAAVSKMLPVLGILLAMLTLGAYRPGWIAAAIVIATFAGVLVGALQVGSGDPESSPWYFYRLTNFGTAVGFFADGNHMASLLVVCIPFLIALGHQLRSRSARSGSTIGTFVMVGAGLGVILVGVALNGSLAGLILGLPVLAASLMMVAKDRRKLRLPVILAGFVAAAAAVAVYQSPAGDKLLSRGDTDISVSSRQAMWRNTAKAAVDHLPLGSGLGSFIQVYRRYEDPALVGRTYVNNAHNDYLEVALDLGLPGIVLMLTFLIWWVRRAGVIWRSSSGDRYAQAATIASAALLIHSSVEYPLRSVALAAVMAACMAIMALPPVRKAGDGAGDLRPTRHLSV